MAPSSVQQSKRGSPDDWVELSTTWVFEDPEDWQIWDHLTGEMTICVPHASKGSGKIRSKGQVYFRQVYVFQTLRFDLSLLDR